MRQKQLAVSILERSRICVQQAFVFDRDYQQVRRRGLFSESLIGTNRTIDSCGRFVARLSFARHYVEGKLLEGSYEDSSVRISPKFSRGYFMCGLLIDDSLEETHRQGHFLLLLLHLAEKSGVAGPVVALVVYSFAVAILRVFDSDLLNPPTIYSLGTQRRDISMAHDYDCVQHQKPAFHHKGKGRLTDDPRRCDDCLQHRHTQQAVCTFGCVRCSS